MKMKKNIELIAILMAVLAACLFTACYGGAMEELWKDELENGNVPVSERCTVTFVSNGGSEVASQTIEKGTCAVKPQDPIFGTYTFNGWFLKNSDQSFDFSTPITEDLTLYAHWEGLVETKTTTKELDLSQGGTIVVAVSPIPSQNTSVAIPEGALSGTGSHSSELAVTSYAIEVSTTTFQILNQSAQNNLAVAGIDCALKIDDEIVSDFNKPIIITTYIPKGLSSVEVIYNGDAAKSQPDAGGTAPNKNVAKIYNNDIGETNLGYDKTTGLLRFSTDHFSEFYVATNAEVCIVKDSASSDVSAMTLGEFRDDVNNDNDYEGYTVTVLKDCDYTGVSWESIGKEIYGQQWIPFYGKFDGDNHTIKVKNTNITPNDYFGFFGLVINEDPDDTKRIYDINLEVEFVASEPYTVLGGLVGETYGYVDIENVNVSGSIKSTRVAGGIIGNALDGLNEATNPYKISNCCVSADVSSYSVMTSNNWLAVGGIVGQNNLSDGLTIENCKFTGKLETLFDAGYQNNASSYMGYALAKGANDGGEEVTTINNFIVGEGSSIVGYQNVETHNYPFEGLNKYTGNNTYTGTPNHSKELLGGYFYQCTIDGVKTGGSGQNFYPHGGAK